MADMPFSFFPVDDPDAANAWLADESNHDFREWEDASLEDKNKWAELETALSAVTGLKPLQYNEKHQRCHPRSFSCRKAYGAGNSGAKAEDRRAGRHCHHEQCQCKLERCIGEMASG